MDGHLLELEIDVVVDFHLDVVPLDLEDLAEDTAGHHHLVPLGQVGHQLLMLLLALALGANDQKVHEQEQPGEHQQGDHGVGFRRRRGLGKSQQFGGQTHENLEIETKEAALYPFSRRRTMSSAGGCGSGIGPEPGEHVVVVGLGVDLRHDVAEAPIPTDDEGHAVDTVVLPPHELLRPPDPVLVRHNVIRVGEQVEAQPLLVFEFLEFRHRVGADPEHHRIEGVEGFATGADATGLGGAAGGHRLGIEVQHHARAALEILEADFFAALVEEGEGGGKVADLGLNHEGSPRGCGRWDRAIKCRCRAPCKAVAADSPPDPTGPSGAVDLARDFALNRAPPRPLETSMPPALKPLLALLLAPLLLAANAPAAAPTGTQAAPPSATAQGFRAQCDSWLADLDKAITALERVESPRTVARVLEPLNAIQTALFDGASQASLYEA